MKSLKFYLSLVVSVCFAVTAHSQLAVETETNADALAAALVGDNENLSIDAATLIGAEGSAGTFSMGEFGIEEGILLTSGEVSNAVGPNSSGGISTSSGTPGDPDLDVLSAPFSTNDATILEITFTPSAGEVLEFSYVFGSDEYNEYVCSSFNDPFGFFINGGDYIDENIALIPGTDIPVTINNVNNGSVGSNGSDDNCTEDQLSNSEFFFDNSVEEGNSVFSNCEYDGLTTVLTVSIPVEIGVQYTIRLAIADAGDTALDSGVFIEGGSFDVIDYDCDEIQADFGDPCETEDGAEGTINQNCMCMANPECPDLGGDPGDPCLADGNVDGTINDDCQCIPDVVDPCPDLDGDPGDACVTAEGADGTISEDCQCVANQNNEEGCQDFRYFLANYDGNQSDIYGIEIVGGEAQMTWLKTLDYGLHIAYNPSDDLLYIVRSSNGSFRTLDVSVVDGALSEETPLDMSLGGAVAVAVNNDGKLVIGSSDQAAVFTVEPDGSTSEFGTADVSGGDLVVREDGETVLATRSGGYLYTVMPGNMANMLFGEVSSVVTGLALTANGDYLFSANGSSALVGRASDGSDNGISYPLVLGGNAFTHDNGDLASACFDDDELEGDCQNFKYFYANHGSGVSGSDLYSVELNGSAAELTHLLNVNYQIHIGYNPADDIVYLVNANGNFVEFYDVASESVIGSVNIDADIDQLYAVVYNPSDGLIYVGDANSDEIYTIDPGDGSTTFFADAPVQGGDLVLQAGNLFLAKRTTDDLYTVVADADGIADETSEATLIGTLPDETNGMAAMNNETSLLCARFGTTIFAEISNTDGTLLNEYTIWLDDEPFEIQHGDLASGCADSDPFEEDCAYQLYYTHEGPGEDGYALWEVTLNEDNTASYNELQSDLGEAHIALSPDGSKLYIVGGSNVRTYDLGTNTVTNDVNIATGGGQNLSGFPSAVCGADGMLYAGQASGNQVYAIDPVTGLASAFGPTHPLNGGDLIFAGGELWSINRSNNTFYLVSDGGATNFTVPVNQINGAAVLDNGNVLVADGGTTLFKELDISNPDNVSVVAEYDTGVDLNNGDLAGRCIGINPFNPDLQGECYATEVIEYVEGESSNGGNIAQNRSDATQALGDPERMDQLVFVSLGYGGSLTLAFDGAVPNQMGDDIEVVETTYGNNSCASYDEYADVYVSQNGTDYFFAKTICRSDNMVDISDAGDFTYILYVKIVNNDELSNTPDAFDVDGVVAMANCVEEGDEAGLVADDSFEQPEHESQIELSSFPNPTGGQSTVSFEMNTSERTTLEVYDMNGRSVATLFNAVANADQLYRFDFNATSLPEGVYIYRLTTESEVVIEKFIVTR